jgi:hypothetical protein
MSFIDKISGKARKAKARDEDVGSMFDEIGPGTVDDSVAMQPGGGAALALNMRAARSAPALTPESSSLTSEVLPSEVGGEFIETRMPGVDRSRPDLVEHRADVLVAGLGLARLA